MNAKSFIKRPITVLSFIVFVIAIVAAAKFGLVTKAKPQAPVLVPNISATNVDTLFTDVDGDGRVDPGDTILYTVVINNAGTDATNTVFTSTLDANTTLVGGSVNTSPIATDDASYTAAGNVRITVAAGSGVLVNDIDPDTGNNTGLTASAGATSANGGNVAMSANGGFSYNPAPGFTGTDTFTYTVTDAGGATGTGTVTFNVSGMIWFVNAAAGAGGDGRLTNPFNCYTGAGCFSAVAADDPGDNIFLYTGAYTGGNTLLANQRLIGQGAGASLSTITGITPPTGSDALPATGGTRPSITTVVAATNAINLGSGNTLRGFNIGNTTAADIVGSSFGTLTATEMTLSGTGRALDLTTGTLAATFDSITSTSSLTQGIVLTTVGGTLTVSGTTSISGAGTQGISISGSSVAANFGTSTTIDSTTQGILVGTSTGNVSFGNTIVTPGTDGVSLQNNSGGTRSFGTLSTTNGSGVGFFHSTAGGTTTVSGLATFTNPGGRCMDIQDSTTAITFANVNATQCGGTGVFMDDNAAGGTVTFADLDISPDSGQRSFHATDNLGTITTTSGTIPGAGTAIPIEIVGLSLVSVQPLNIQFTSVSASGASSGIILTNTSSSGAPGGFRVLGTASGSDRCGGTVTGTTTPGTPATVNAPVDAECTGGAILNSTNDGVALNNAASVSLSRMRILDAANSGVFGDEVNGFSLINCRLESNGDDTLAEDSALEFQDLLGTINITNSTLSNSFEHSLNWQPTNNAAATPTMTISGTNIGPNPVGSGANGIHYNSVFVNNTATLIVSDSNVQGNQATGISVNSDNSAVQNLKISNTTIRNNNIAINLNSGLNADTNFNIINNTMIFHNNFAVGLVPLSTSTTSSVYQGFLNGNFIGNGTVDSGSRDAYGIRGDFRGDVDAIISISNNNIRNTDIEPIFIEGRLPNTAAGTPLLDLTIRNNTLGIPDDNSAFPFFSVYGMRVESRDANAMPTANPVILTADVAGNNTTGLGGFEDIRFRQRDLTTFRVERLTDGDGTPNELITSMPTVEAQMAADNPGNTTDATQQTVATGYNEAANGATRDPSLPGPILRPAPIDGERQTSDALENNLSFINSSYQTPSEMLATIGSEFRVQSSESSVSSPSVSAGVTAESIVTTEQPAQAQTGTLLYSRVSSFIDEIASMISPTVIAQETDNIVPQSGELVCIDGDVDIDVGTCTGPGFTLPAGKSVTIKFRATIDVPPPILTQVSNQGSVSGSNFASPVLTDDPSIGGATDPTLTLIDSTSIVVSSSQNPSITGQSVTFTATLTGAPAHGSGNPTGTVEFFDGVTSLGTAPTVAGAVNTSTATLPVSSLTAASHNITADFLGGGGFNANDTSNTLVQVVSNTAVWDGSTSTAWADGTNWTTNAAPSLATNDVSIPAGAIPNNPTISAGNVTVNNLTLSAGRTLTVNSAMALTVNGTLTMNGNNIVGGAAGTVVIGPGGSVVRTTGAIETNLNMTYTAASNKTFDVGTANGYSPVQMNITAGTFPLNFTIRAEQTKHPNAIFPVASSLKRYWIVTPSGGSPTATMTFNWLDPTDIMGDETMYRLARVTGGTPFIYGNIPSIVINPAANTATITGATIFSDWTLAAVPTAASVSVGGRVFDSEGRAVSNAQLSMVDGDGNVRLARTNPFGYYRFFDIPAGAGYTISVNHKLYQFTPQFITVYDAREDLDFIASP